MRTSEVESTRASKTYLLRLRVQLLVLDEEVAHQYPEEQCEVDSLDVAVLLVLSMLRLEAGGSLAAVQ